jgi:hypothetical protein
MNEENKQIMSINRKIVPASNRYYFKTLKSILLPEKQKVRTNNFTT